jgi:hypothetical protein
MCNIYISSRQMLLANDVFNLDVSFSFYSSCLCVCVCESADPNIDTSNTLENDGERDAL